MWRLNGCSACGQEEWGFDVHGFLIIRGALRGAALAECQGLASPWR